MASESRDKRLDPTSSREMAQSSRQQPARRSGYDRGGSDDFYTSPFSLIRRMHDEIDRLFDTSFGRQTGSASIGRSGSWWPAVEVSESENEVTVCAELPGLRPEDVRVEATEGAIVIQGERRQQSENEQGGVWRSERHYGQFYRTVPLPEGANADQARAEFQNGELRVMVPVSRSESRRRQIPISSSQTR